MANCFNHDDREAVSRCAVCGKGVCEECAKKAGDMTFCSDECKGKAAAMTGRSNDVLNEKAKSDSASLVRKLIYVFVLIAAVAAAWYFYDQHQKTLDNKVNSSFKKMQKSTSNFLKETKKAIPTSSDIKRQKEKLVK